MLYHAPLSHSTLRVEPPRRRTNARVVSALIFTLAMMLGPVVRAQTAPSPPPTAYAPASPAPATPPAAANVDPSGRVPSEAAQPPDAARTPYMTSPQSQGASAPYVGPGPYPGLAPHLGGPDAARGAYVQSLMYQRQAWLNRSVGLGVPITLFTVGLGAIFVGSFVADAFNDCDSYNYDGTCRVNGGGLVSGVLLMIGGGVLASVGTGMFIGRLIRRGRRTRELRRIDSELHAFGVTASVEPWVNRSAHVVSAGLNAGLRF